MPVTAGAISAGASVLNNTINGLFQSGVTNAKKNEVNAQTNQINEQTILNQLSNEQNYTLNQEQVQGNLANNQEKNLLGSVDAVDIGGGNNLATIYSSGVTSSGNSTWVLVACIVGGIVVLGGGLYFLTKK